LCLRVRTQKSEVRQVIHVATAQVKVNVQNTELLHHVQYMPQTGGIRINDAATSSSPRLLQSSSLVTGLATFMQADLSFPFTTSALVSHWQCMISITTYFGYLRTSIIVDALLAL